MNANDTYRPTPGTVIKSSRTGDLYTVQHVFHSRGFDEQDVYACYRLSAYDGMPIGSIVHIPQNEIVDPRQAADSRGQQS